MIRVPAFQKKRVCARTMCMKPWIAGFVFLLFLCSASGATAEKSPCQIFYNSLVLLPYESIFIHQGLFNSQWFESGAKGCYLVMNTSTSLLAHQSLPFLSDQTESFLDATGWRRDPKYSVISPSVLIEGLKKGDTLCLLYKDKLLTSNPLGQGQNNTYIRVRVECYDPKDGEAPWIVLKDKGESSR